MYQELKHIQAAQIAIKEIIKTFKDLPTDHLLLAIKKLKEWEGKCEP